AADDVASWPETARTVSSRRAIAAACVADAERARARIVGMSRIDHVTVAPAAQFGTSGTSPAAGASKRPLPRIQSAATRSTRGRYCAETAFSASAVRV